MAETGASQRDMVVIGEFSCNQGDTIFPDSDANGFQPYAVPKVKLEISFRIHSDTAPPFLDSYRHALNRVAR